MAIFSAEKVQEIVEEKDAEYKKLEEEEYSYLKEEYGELEEVCQELKRERKNIPLKVKSVYLSQNHITELERITEL